MGRKNHLITGIQLGLSAQGRTIDEIKLETKDLQRKTVAELHPIYIALSKARRKAIDAAREPALPPKANFPPNNRCNTCRGTGKQIKFRPGQREFGGDASTSYETTCPNCCQRCGRTDKPLKHLDGSPYCPLCLGIKAAEKQGHELPEGHSLAETKRDARQVVGQIMPPICPTCRHRADKPFRDLLKMTSRNVTLSGCVDQCHGPWLKPGSDEHRWHTHPRADEVRAGVLAGKPNFRADPGMRKCKCVMLRRIGGLGWNRNGKHPRPHPKCTVCKGSGMNTIN